MVRRPRAGSGAPGARCRPQAANCEDEGRRRPARSAEYERASIESRNGDGTRRQCGDYPLLSRGDINMYSLFVERAQALIKPDGIAGLLTPSGIASDLMRQRVFQRASHRRGACDACSISRTGAAREGRLFS